jgi:hypothetical protein
MKRGVAMVQTAKGFLRSVCVLAVLLLPGSAWGAEAGRVTALEGKADVHRSGAPSAVALKVGDAVQEGDVVRTKRLSTLEIRLRDGSVLKLSELTRLEITKYLLGEQPEGLLQSTRGQVRAIVAETFSKRKDSFRVKTPTAIVGVQGTDFSVQVGTFSPLATIVIVYDGIVSVENVNPAIPGKEILTKGQTTKVEANQPPSPKQDLGRDVGPEGPILQEREEGKILKKTPFGTERLGTPPSVRPPTR